MTTSPSARQITPDPPARPIGSHLHRDLPEPSDHGGEVACERVRRALATVLSPARRALAQGDRHFEWRAGADHRGHHRSARPPPSEDSLDVIGIVKWRTLEGHEHVTQHHAGSRAGAIGLDAHDNETLSIGPGRQVFQRLREGPPAGIRAPHSCG